MPRSPDRKLSAWAAAVWPADRSGARDRAAARADHADGCAAGAVRAAEPTWFLSASARWARVGRRNTALYLEQPDHPGRSLAAQARACSSIRSSGSRHSRAPAVRQSSVAWPRRCSTVSSTIEQGAIILLDLAVLAALAAEGQQAGRRASCCRYGRSIVALADMFSFASDDASE